MTPTTATKLDDSLLQLLQQDIFTSLGLEDLAESERTELLDTMLATIKDRVLARVLDELSAEQKTNLTQLVDAGRAEEVSEFVAEHVPDLEALMNQEAIRYKAEMIQNAAHIRQLVDSDDDTTNTPKSNSKTTDDNLPAVIPDDLPVPYVAPGLPATQNTAL